MKPYMPAASTRRRSDRVSIASLIEFERNDVAGRYFSHRRSTTTVWGFWCYVALSHMARSEQGIEFRRISGTNEMSVAQSLSGGCCNSICQLASWKPRRLKVIYESAVAL